MNKKIFDDEVGRQISPTWRVNVKLMAEWFEWILKRLEAEGEQSKTIEHPGKKGERNEDVLREVIREMMPSAIASTSGFVATCLGTVSKEQDIILFDKERAINLRPGAKSKYLPMETCLASIEVKSQLNINEIRSAVLNCISVKKLLGQGVVEPVAEKNIDTYCYAIFAYGSRHSIERTATQLNEALKEVPYNLRPNVVYVLGKGMLLPSKDGKVSFFTGQLFEEHDFHPFKEMTVVGIQEWSRVFPFLWFISMVVEFCIEKRNTRKDGGYHKYWLTGVNLQARLAQKTGEENGRSKA